MVAARTDRDRRPGPGKAVGQGQNSAGQHDVEGKGAQDLLELQRSSRVKQIEREGGHAHRHGEPRGARHLAGRQHGIAERAVRDEFALRDQDDAGDGKYQHQRQPEQRIDRAIGDAVLQQEQHDRRVQDWRSP